MADDDYSDMDMGYEDEPPEPEIEMDEEFTCDGFDEFEEEGAEDELHNNSNEGVPDPLDDKDKGEREAVERPHKTSKYMTKYERARILGTRAL